MKLVSVALKADNSKSSGTDSKQTKSSKTNDLVAGLINYISDTCTKKGPFTTTTENLVLKFTASSFFKKDWAGDKETKLKVTSKLVSFINKNADSNDVAPWDTAGITVIRLDKSTLAIFNDSIFSLFKELK